MTHHENKESQEKALQQQQQEEKAFKQKRDAEARDARDSELPNQGVGFLLSNAGTTEAFEKARQELENEKAMLANPNRAPLGSKNKWVGPQPQQRGLAPNFTDAEQQQPKAQQEKENNPTKNKDEKQTNNDKQKSKKD
jgi:hypothetical protein